MTTTRLYSREINKENNMSIISADIALAKHQLFKRLRDSLDNQGFCEVSTPIQLASEDRNVFTLRECMELRLRSALASGLKSVYEIGQCFRGDVPDKTHLREFHMLELFWNHDSFDDLVQLTRHLLEVAFMRPIAGFEIIDLAELLPRRYPGFVYGRTYAQLREWAKSFIQPQQLSSFDCSYKIYNHLIDMLVDEMHPGTMERPAMVTNYPSETICIACPQSKHPERIQRSEFFVNGLEIGHGFVDDMNWTDVARKMEENGKDFVDVPFLELLKSGRLPASSGVGFGLDRILKLLLGIDDIRQCAHELQE